MAMKALFHGPARRVAYYIFRSWRRHPQTGEQMWAKDYGLKAWRIPVFAK